jgi:3-oxoacyl-[acyl-carrier protein] reductase
MSKLAGKVAIVTGASKGIGAGIAKQLAADGASVVVNYASDKTGADNAVAEIVKAGGKAIAVGASVSDAAGIATLFAEAKKAYGAVDILVNNAGVYKFAPIEAITAEDIDWMYGINVRGLLLTTQAAVLQFPASGGARKVRCHSRSLALAHGSCSPETLIASSRLGMPVMRLT